MNNEELIKILENEAELCASTELMLDIEQISENHSINYEEIEKAYKKERIKKNVEFASRRTKLSKINLVMFEIIDLFFNIDIENKDNEKEIKTTEIYEILNDNDMLKKLDNIIYKNFEDYRSEYNNEKNTSEYFQVATEVQKKDMINKTLRYLLAYNIVTMDNKKYFHHNTYSLNLDNWFRYTEHPLYDETIQQNLMPLLISFIKFTAPHMVDQFYERIDNLVESIFEAPNKYSKSSSIENFIIKAFAKNELVSFDVFDEKAVASLDGIDNIRDVKIKEIFINEDSEKIIIFKNEGEDVKEYELNIKNIYRIHIINENNKVEESVALGQQGFVVYNDSYCNVIKNKNYPPVVQKYNVLLELDTNLHTYFQMNPLKEQEMYRRNDERKKFFSKESRRIWESQAERQIYSDIFERNAYKQGTKFYVTATDTKDKVLDVVKKSIPNVKILYPSVLNDELTTILKEYCS